VGALGDEAEHRGRGAEQELISSAIPDADGRHTSVITFDCSYSACRRPLQDPAILITLGEEHFAYHPQCAAKVAKQYIEMAKQLEMDRVRLMGAIPSVDPWTRKERDDKGEEDES
jgi:hypothetical protein